MRPVTLSKHASTRLQQRDKPARRRLRSYAGPLAAFLEAHLDYYAVVGADGTIVTAAHRITRIKH